MIRRNNQSGYTIVELLITTTIFSVILLGAAATLIQINRMYYKGVITARTQETSRKIADEIVTKLQFTGQPVVSELTTNPNYPANNSGGAETRAFCIGNDRYTFVLNAKVTDNETEGAYDSENHEIIHGLWRDRVDNPEAECIPVNGSNQPVLPDLSQKQPTAEGTELLEQNMRVRHLSLRDDNNDGVWNLRLSVVYGDDELLTNNFQVCKGTIVGGQWCAVSDLSMKAYKRVQSN